VPDDPAYDFGQGAGFYVDATEAPFSANFRMYSYIVDELPAVLEAAFPVDPSRQAITGHSMGGHGALTLALRKPGPLPKRLRLRSDRRAEPGAVGEKALGRYLGEDRSRWRGHDAVALIEDGARVPEILVDQGTSDSFLEQELRPELLSDACSRAGIDLALRMQQGYDHSYHFISTFMEDHLRWHAERLSR
jgi:S-formylglutathione hydrolase